LAVGASNRDDITLARAAEASNIKVNRFARQQTHASAALDWHINADQRVLNHAFLSHRYHLAILETSRYASGLSIAVRAGYAGQLLIASDTPHMREVILDGETGILVRLRDSVQLAETIGLLTSGKIDSKKMSAAHEDYCRAHHSYDVLRHHIETLVARCV
jgi:glycosyltransferase involved in cell wall biosynthesis